MNRFQRKPLPESRNPRASSFGAIDFIVTSAGEWVFIGDVNPNGQWAWIGELTPRIASAIADALQGRTTPP